MGMGMGMGMGRRECGREATNEFGLRWEFSHCHCHCSTPWHGVGRRSAAQRRRGLARLGLSMLHGDAGAGAEKRRFGRAENLKQFVKRLWIASGNVQEA